MAIKVKAVERNVSFDKNSEKWAYVMQADLYGKLSRQPSPPAQPHQAVMATMTREEQACSL